VASALLSFSTHDFGEASRVLYAALLEAKLLVAAGGPPQSETDGMDVRLVAAPDETGDPRLLAFTSERSFGFGGQAAPFAVAPAPGLFGFALRNGVTRVSIDSGGPVSATLERWELEALAEGRIPTAPRRKLSMRPVEPGSLPGLVGALGEMFSPRSVFLLEEDAGGARRLLLGMTAPPPIAVDELADRLGGVLPGGEGVSLLRLTEKEADELQRAGVRRLP